MLLQHDHDTVESVLTTSNNQEVILTSKQYMKEQLKFTESNEVMFSKKAPFLFKPIRIKNLYLEDGTPLEIKDCAQFDGRIWVNLEVNERLREEEHMLPPAVVIESLAQEAEAAGKNVGKVDVN